MVLDLGAGDGRFALHGRFEAYTGIELDHRKVPARNLPTGATIVHRDALEAPVGFDLVIGNPPYTRHHDITRQWRERARTQIHEQTGVWISRFANLYQYFVWLALTRSRHDGLVAQVVPLDWVNRPSAKPLRDHLRAKGYAVHVFELRNAERLFPDVKTTASFLIIDKNSRTCVETFSAIYPTGKFARKAKPRPTPRVIPYEKSGQIWASRGISTGSQKVFILTEAERQRKHIPRDAVVPCVTSLRGLPSDFARLTRKAFENHYVQNGARCWLLRTDLRNSAVMRHIHGAPLAVRRNWTCRKRPTWYEYDIPKAPMLFYSVGFRGRSPKVVANSAGAVAAGGVAGIFSKTKVNVFELRTHLAGLNVASQVIAHARGLRKLEIRQMNAILNAKASGAP